MSRLILVRDHPADIAHRYAIMSVDGKLVARMKYKERVVIELPPGSHLIEGKNELGMARTVAIETKEDEDTVVHIGGITIGCMSWFAGILPPTPSIVMRVNEGWSEISTLNWKD